MRLIHKVPFTPQESEMYRQLVFNNVIHGMKAVTEALENFGEQVSDDNKVYNILCREDEYILSYRVLLF